MSYPVDGPFADRKVPLTDAELAADRKLQLDHLQRLIVIDNPAAFEYTCDRCSDNRVCVLVFDGYNTDGDCLASK